MYKGHSPNMHTIIISGFLGSGKTTFLLQALNHISSKGATSALIINEIGELGIDNQLFNQVGNNVWEVLGGCICCTSVSGFQQAWEEIIDTVAPDYLFIEPSGIANPPQVEEAVSNCQKKTDDIQALALLDSDRIDVILEAVYPLTVDTIKMAHTVLITKAALPYLAQNIYGMFWPQ